MQEQVFSVLDLETTGLYAKVDRIIEVAIVKIDYTGEVLSEYTTLVNPQRDVSAYHIHGLSARDVIHAPKFEDIAGKILEILKGSMLVAHNANFDVRFLDSEYRRLGYYLPDIPYICTMLLAGHIHQYLPSRKLTALCQYFGIGIERAHSALDDAVATSQLLVKLLSGSTDLEQTVKSACMRNKYCPSPTWPDLPYTGEVLTREDSQRGKDDDSTYIPQLVSRLPLHASQKSNAQNYLMILDRALEDRKISAEEAVQLYEVASECGISKKEAQSLHVQYLCDLVDVALQDSVITDSELNDLKDVRRLLGISQRELEAIIKEQSEKPNLNDRVRAPNQDLRGISVCFTGELEGRLQGEIISRSLAQFIASEHGLNVRNNVTKDLDMLVTRDPDSLSGKAVRARRYGTRIVAERVFWQMLGVNVE